MLIADKDMLRRYFGVIPCAFLLVLASCHSSTLHFDDTEYIVSPMEVGVKNVQSVDLGIKGIIDMRIRGPYMVVATSDVSGFIKVFDAESRTILGSFFAQGNGPGELIVPITASSMFFTKEGDKWFASFNSNKGTFIRFDIEESINEQRTVFQEYGSIPSGPCQALDLGNDTFFYKVMSPDRNSQIRYLLRHDQRTTPSSFEVLNSATLTPPSKDDGSYFNALSTIVNYDPEKDWLYEASTELNTIHVYSEDGSMARTICFGDKLDNYDSVVKKDFNDRIQTFVSMDLFPEFCLILYQGSTFYEIDTGNAKEPTLLLLNLDEGTIVTIPFPCRATSFALDQERVLLYSVDRVNEEVISFELSE